MELYFKDLISKEASLEKLVDDMSLVVQGADDYAAALGTHLPSQSREEVTSRLNRLKSSCQRVKEQTIAGAQATDQFLRKYPYWSLAATFALGLLIGVRSRRGR
jgi:ElaB/YqjD/DUF883 family membrane-anchored ribosome-binding protein